MRKENQDASMLLGAAFFITALLYAAVGFGGGSTYNALLALAGTDYRIMPSVALICNLIVVCGGTARFFRAGHVDMRRIAPWIMASVPAAWLGGFLHVPEKVFTCLLGASLMVAGIQVFLQKERDDLSAPATPEIRKYSVLPFAVGGGLGFVAGITGIGGGIFLAPVLYLLRWGDGHKIAGACSFFILVNSLAGLTGQLMKLDDPAIFSQIAGYWILFPAVLIGGQAGSYLGAVRFNHKILRVMTAILILYVSVRLLGRWWGME